MKVEPVKTPETPEEVFSPGVEKRAKAQNSTEYSFLSERNGGRNGKTPCKTLEQDKNR
jgi:hypothetical protein